MSAALHVADELAQTGVRPALRRRVLVGWRHGDRKLRIRRGQCRECRCSLARDERRCRTCFVPREEPRVHIRAAPTWTDNFKAMQDRAARSNWQAAARSRSRAASLLGDVEPARVVRTFTKAQESEAIKAMRQRPVRRGIERDELINEAWIELVNPRVNVAAREAGLTFAECVVKAVQRAYSHLRPSE